MALDATPGNERLLAYLRGQAVVPAEPEAWQIDDHELHCHPELVDRLEDVGRGIVQTMTPAFGLPVLVHPNGVAFAFAQGTSTIALRLPLALQREVLDAPGSGRAHRFELEATTLRFSERLGADWVAADPWPIELTPEAGLEQLRRWCRRAYENADGR